MIPLQLTLKNFLSYRNATLDFRGLHVVCICGANGAGKSSLLEAIAWVIWGESRAQSEDDVIHLGCMEAQVDFIFQCRDQVYRMIRSRHRGQSSALELQVQTPGGFRSLTEKGLRATQQLVLQHLKLDYDTFINSAYLRQGRADEFMLKRPGDRKQILADLLKLDQYDQLAEQAKEQARQLKADIGAIDRSLTQIELQLQQRDAIAAQISQLHQTIATLRQQQQTDAEHLRQQQQQQQQRQAWQQHVALQQQQQQHLAQDCHHLQQTLTQTQQQQRQLEALLNDAEAIASRYAQWQQWQREEEQFSAKFQAFQAADRQRQQWQQQKAEQLNQLQDQLRQAQAQLEAIEQQQQEVQQVLGRATEIETALKQLHQARAKLTELDRLQMQSAPLVQRRQQVQQQIDRAQAQLLAKLEQVQSLQQQLSAQQQPQLQQTIEQISTEIDRLDRRRAYQQQVRDKGMERKTFLEQLQERQRQQERKLSEIDQKILLLHQAEPALAEAALEPALEAAPASPFGETGSLFAPSPTAVSLRSPQAELPPCPLCDRPLDAHHRHLVLARHQQERQEILNQLWVIREQLTTSDREIRVLRQEYRDLEQELSQFDAMREQRGQLQAQLQQSTAGQARLEQLAAEQAELQRSIEVQDYATGLFEERRLLDQSLAQFSYDDKDHALARGQVDRWRWAEIKQSEIKQAQKRQADLQARQPELQQTIAQLQQQIADWEHSPLQQQLRQVEQYLSAIGYSVEQHTALRQAVRQAQPWQLHYQELTAAQQQYPQVQQQLRELIDRWTTQMQSLQTLTTQIETAQQQLAHQPNLEASLPQLEQQMQQTRSQLDRHLAELGRLEQQQQQIDSLQSQQTQQTSQVQLLQRQLRVHQELAQAFGKNGIQALMIENVLPQLEAETNQILGRLSANQLHVQFVTQRSKRGSSGRASQAHSATKLIDTLDILISDVQGTRPYETYSGGEAFRVNFAIRLAIARLLAQRSGTALQLLIVDEGFGTQDEAGCDRLISALNAIAADFACILTVTHMPHLKAAFQTRIEVYKTEEGSKLQLSV